MSGLFLTFPKTSSGGLRVTEIEIDFGSLACRSKSFTITDETVTSDSKIIAVQSAKAATGRSEDENEMDYIRFSCSPGTGQFTLYAFADTVVSGKFIVNYTVG